MKKLYNYTNTKNVKCVVVEGVVGFKIDDYPINKMRKELKLDPIPNGKTWRCDELHKRGQYLISIDFQSKKLVFTPTHTQNISLWSIPSDTYFNVKTAQVGKLQHFDSTYYDSTYYLEYSEELNGEGKRVLTEVSVQMVDFEVPIKLISSMEFIDKWWKKNIYIKLNFIKSVFSSESLTLTFERNDEKDANSILDRINIIRRMIEDEDRYDYIGELEEKL